MVASAVPDPTADRDDLLAGKTCLVSGSGNVATHAAEKITSDMKPSQALRRGKGTSLWNAIQSVKEGDRN